MKKFMMVFAMFAVLVGFGAVSSGTAEARTDSWVATMGKSQVYIDTDSVYVKSHTQGKGLDDRYVIYAEYHFTDSTNTLRLEHVVEILNGNANVTSYQLTKNGGRVSQRVNVQNRSNIDTIMFLAAWDVAVGGYPF